MYVVTVLLELNPGHEDSFAAAVLENAGTSLNDEAGCHRFDVAFSEDGLRCFLYEWYTDRAAFDVHLRTPHFLAFDGSSSPMVRNKRVESYLLVGPSPPLSDG